MGSLARNAHCDGAYLQFNLNERYKADYESSCGMACRDLQQWMKSSKIGIDYFQSKVDHTQYVAFTSNHTVLVGGSFKSKSFLAFRGTVAFDIINMRRNFVFSFKMTTLCGAAGGCAVHQGFWRNFLALRPALVCTIEDIDTWTFVGVSMGAPLAALGAVQTVSLAKKMLGVVTFGMPRVANAAFAAFALESLGGGVGTVGFAYGRDPVPHVPPRALGYRSTQSKLFHTVQETFYTRVQSSEFNTRADDHDIGNYVFFDRLYVNAPWDFGGDKLFATSSVILDLADHSKYFDITGVVGCGFDYADSFIHVSNAAELFFM